jgi:short-subunit dehydrogenase
LKTTKTLLLTLYGGYQAMMKGDDKIVSGLKNKAMVGMSNVLPETMVAEQMNKMQEPKSK